MIIIYSNNIVCKYCKVIEESGLKYKLKNEDGTIFNASKQNIKKSFSELNSELFYELLINKAALSLDDLTSLGFGIPKKLSTRFKLDDNDIIQYLKDEVKEEEQVKDKNTERTDTDAPNVPPKDKKRHWV